jgi:hypothetical protein
MPRAGGSRFREDVERVERWSDPPPREPTRARRADRRTLPRAVSPVRAAEPAPARPAQRLGGARRADTSPRRAERLSVASREEIAMRRAERFGSGAGAGSRGGERLGGGRDLEPRRAGRSGGGADLEPRRAGGLRGGADLAPHPPAAVRGSDPRPAGTGVPGRRTVTIRGRGDERLVPGRPRGRRRAPERPYERAGFRPDRVAMWAVMLGLLLVLVAATSSHAAPTGGHGSQQQRSSALVVRR